MFDNLEVRKSYKIMDNVTGNNIEVCTFNATLNKDSGIYQNMNISYPRLYDANREDILTHYREFNANVSSLACVMGLADSYSPGTLEELEPLREEFKQMALEVFNEVIASLGSIQVNPVPVIDVAGR